MSSFSNSGIDSDEGTKPRSTSRQSSKSSTAMAESEQGSGHQATANPTGTKGRGTPISWLPPASSRAARTAQVLKQAPIKRKQAPVSSSETSSGSNSSSSASSDESSGHSASSTDDSSSDWTSDSDEDPKTKGSTRPSRQAKCLPASDDVKRAKVNRAVKPSPRVSIGDIEDCVDVTILGPVVGGSDFGSGFLTPAMRRALGLGPEPMSSNSNPETCGSFMGEDGRGGMDTKAKPGTRANEGGPTKGGRGTGQGLQPASLTPAMFQKYINTATQYLLIRDMRHDPNSLCHQAPVDTMGCSVSGDRQADPKTFRFQTLVSLLLSSQTKDAVTFDAVSQLRTKLPQGLTPEGVLANPILAHQCISKVGFHNRKFESLVKVARICLDDYEGDIPRDLKGLLALPGVGPKMAHLTMQAAWGEKSGGIGVDTHVHRIVNMLDWVNETTATPEKTRIALEAVLPRQLFSEINWLLVGFGQTICPSRGPKCGDCALAKNLLCGSSTTTQFRDDFDRQATELYHRHLRGEATPVSGVIDRFANATSTENGTTSTSSVPKPLLKELRHALVQISLQTKFNITPERLQSFISDDPPPLPGDHSAQEPR